MNLDRNALQRQDTGISQALLWERIEEGSGREWGGISVTAALLSHESTVSQSDVDGSVIRRRAEAFAWNRELYRQWIGGGSCWLDRDPGEDSDNGDNNGGGDGGNGSLPHLQ